jgi:exodeoxyribonuclease VII large subunit
LDAYVYSVAEITRQIKLLLEESFPLLWVEGEISNFRPHHSGHLYFTLKDDEAQLSGVMWRSRAESLAFDLSDGLKVRVYGNIRVYEKSGRYQIDCLAIQPAGLGDLQVRFEKLKQQLLSEGLFETAHKKPIPQFPRIIGIVSSPTGAAIHDIFSVIGRRAPSVEIIFRGVKVQGDGAAGEIADAIEMFNRFGGADVLIVGRGGGSLEDLWAFNEEIVARAIYNSKIPVVSAVGHEIDFTIADFTADLRAPTPSAAAELVVPDEQQLREKLLDAADGMAEILNNQIAQQRQRLSEISRGYAFRAAEDRVRQYAQHLDELIHRAGMLSTNYLLAKGDQIRNLSRHLNSVSPDQILQRGYALLFKKGDLVKSVLRVGIDDQLEVRLHDGRIETNVTGVRHES